MQFKSKPLEEHHEVPLPDEGRWEQLIARWAKRDVSQPSEHRDQQNACYVVSVSPAKELHKEARLAEIVGLVRAQGDAIVGSEIYRLTKPDPRMLIRSGIAADIAGRAEEAKANMLVIDAELSPSQMRNLEEATGLAVCDREAVILNVFRRHAKTGRARIQVEIAHLQYLRPRIRGMGLDMDQQAGGIIGGRGAGETASELAARRLDARLAVLQKALVTSAQRSTVERRGRQSCQRIALVGYTNAGKTSLMNALTSAGLSAADRPFETLDTTTRCLTRHGGDVLLSDTVGFIRNLPNRLYASFESTLAEIIEASLLVVVVDAADPEVDVHLQTTEDVLARLGAAEIPRLIVYNKSDLLSEVEREKMRGKNPLRQGLMVSSHDKEDVEILKQSLLAHARSHLQPHRLFLPYQATDAISTLYAQTRVLDVRSSETGLYVVFEAANHIAKEIGRMSKDREPALEADQQ